MYEELGRLVRERRETLGLEQAELATELGIRQQAISGWERGRSRPRRTMLRDLARLLSVDESALVAAGSYLPPRTPASGPVRPLTRALPLDELPEERFEDLIAEVMAAMHPSGHASRYGGRGHKQYGIDILVTGNGENLASGQCKRHKEFGPAAVRSSIAEVTVAAKKHYLFLSRTTATPGARSEAAKQRSWELWDGEDISRFIRDLPRDRAVRIVDTYFPGHREAFLGIASAGPWLLPEEYFDTARSMIFNHNWGLAGRVDELNELERSAYRATASLSIVTGHGGVGKTRLLKELADAAPNETVQIRILPGDTHVTAADYELLPREGDLVVIIDDQHEFADVTPVVANIWRWNRDTKIVLATRPYGQRWLRENLERAGLLLDDRAEIELGDLTFEAAEKLAREALGDDIAEAVVRRLARLTTDSPLATVVGGVLIKRGELDPSALEQDDTVREQIMRGFRDALIRDPLADDPRTRSAVLDALAGIQPFRINETTARESLSEIVGKPYDIVHKHLRSLENAGILRRRGDSLRIVPDLLGDVILADAAYGYGDPLGTGYLARIEPLVVGASAEHLFVNVNRIDWQVHQRHDRAPSLADSLWAAFHERIRQADLIERRQLVRLLAKVAYFQPERTLQVTRWIIDHPTTEMPNDHPIWSVVPQPSYAQVLHELPPALKLAAMNIETLGEALSQLWELAQADERPTNPHPQHALRVLREIAEFDVGKPLAYNVAVIETVTTWFADELRISPVEVLEPMLATEGDDSSLRGHTIMFRPFPFIPTSVMPVRQRIVDLAFEEIRSPDLRRAAAAVNLLKAALRYPSGTFGREVTREERDGWTPGIVDTIQRLGALGASGSLDPAIIVGIRDALYWHENYSSTETRQAAETAVQGLPAGIDSLLALTLHEGWGRLIRDRGDAFETIESKRIQLIQDVIAGLSSLTDDQVIELVLDRLEADRAAYGPAAGHPGPMIAGLIQARQSLAQGFLQHIRSATAPTALESLLPVVLAIFADIDAPHALASAKELLAEGPTERRLSVIQALSWNRGARSLAAGELDLLLQLASDRSPEVRRGAARAAQVLAHTHKIEASKLLTAIRFADDPQLADEIFMCFSEQLGMSWDDFSEQDLARLREDLVVLDDISEYSITSALAKRSATHPEWVVRLLQDRVEHAERLESLDGYRPMPFSWDNPLRVRETAEFAAGLSGILTWIADNLDSWIRRDIGADVFSAVASGYDKNVVGILTSALAIGGEEITRAVTSVLRKAHRTFIWDEADFVRTTLQSASHLGDKIRREVSGALYGATISGARSGTPGEPFPEDIEQRDRSLMIAEQLPTGSIEHKFYSAIAKAAEASIAREMEDDVPDDGRDW